MANSPRDRRNRKGCFIILAVLGVFALAYFVISLNSKPSNSVASHIQTLPAPSQ